LTVENGKVTWMNGPEAFGWPASSLIDGTPSLLWHPEDREQAHRLRELAAPGSTQRSILRVVAREAGVRWVEVEMAELGQAEPSRARQEQGLCLITLLDVTQQMLAHERVAESDSEVALFSEYTKDVICRTDVDERLNWASSSVRRLLGWDPQELIGTYLADLVHPEDRQKMRPQSVLGGSRGLLRMRMRDGGYRWMSPRSSQGGHGEKVNAFTEVDALVRSHEQLEVHARTLGEVVYALPMPHLLLLETLDVTGLVDFDVIDANKEALDFLGRPANEVIGSAVSSVLAGPAATILDRLRIASAGDQLSFSQDWQLAHGDGRERTVEIHATPVTDGLSLSWREVHRDPCGLDRLQDVERRYRILAENSSDAVAWLAQGVIKWASPSVTSVLGWLLDDWAGRRLEEFVHVDDLEGFEPVRAVAHESESSPGHGSGRFRIRSKDLSYRWVEANVRPNVDPDGRPHGVVAALRIVDAEVKAMRELDHQARTDDLTGLMNRREALQRIASMGLNSRRSGHGIAVLFCDVDQFKVINDGLGHAVGDVVLRTLAHRITACVRGGDFAARVGGDEMLVVLDGVHGIADAVDIAEKIRVAASMPMPFADALDAHTSDRQVTVTMSIGVVHVTSAQDVSEAVARADVAMYQAKRAGANRVFCLHQEQLQAC